ncbi:hypothetical protein FACS1894159_03670 [Bacteroidia bacterium]|nr:hypothetical protein FACS1894159_03670 [Bacteroidia bacterium]
MKLPVIISLLSVVAVLSVKGAGKNKSAEPAAKPDMSVLDNYFPVRSFYISLPAADMADEFIEFVRGDLIPGGFNNLTVRVNWSFPFLKHPELVDTGAWSVEKIGELVKVCREGGVTLVPMINLLGHQSWEGRALKLLQVYPQFDERPSVKLPSEYKYPNADRLYCKSYCPNHPDLHPILFACIDEIVDAFEADNFHAGMDEVFDIADPYCPRCQGMDPAAVFAAEVNRINAHLKARSVRLWIWADRLIDGGNSASGYGEWSASLNNTHRAIEMIDRDVMMCDWHYRIAEQSAVLFALKGYDVITCGWIHPSITERQLEDLIRFRRHSSKYTGQRYRGFMQTVWSGFPNFIKELRNGSDQVDYAARNYTILKEAFIRYAKEFAGKPLEEKDGRRLTGQ